MKKKYSLFSNLKYMISTAWKVQRMFLMYLLILIFTSVALGIVEIYTIPQIVEKVISEKSFESIIKTILFFGGLSLVFDTIYSYYISIIAPAKIEIRTVNLKRVVTKYLSMSYPLILDKDVLSLKTKAMTSMYSNNVGIELIWDQSVSFISKFTLVAFYIFILAKLPIFLLIFTISTTILSFYLSKNLKEWRYKNRKEEGEHQNKLQYVFTTSLNHKNAKDIRMFGLTQWLSQIYENALQLYRDFEQRAAIRIFFADFVELLLNLLRNTLVYYYLISMVLNNKLDTSLFLLYFATQSKLTSDMQMLLREIFNIYKSNLEISTIREFIEYPEIYKFEDGEKLDVNNSDINLELRNVSYKYPLSDEYILEDINLKVRIGEKIAVVGLNGAGKTTLIKLICGLLDPTDGEVLINGKNIKIYNRKDYYKIFSAVFQENSLFAGTLALNIANDIDYYDKGKMEKVIELSGLRSKVDKLANGVDTNIVKDVYEDAPEFSGGEMQKILLARAIYRNSPILILDEPTAALDPIAEREIYTKYNELSRNTLSFFISHRLASTKFCDYIILIQNKKIYEKGTHDGLMQLGGSYKKLFDTQSRYYMEENHEK